MTLKLALVTLLMVLGSLASIITFRTPDQEIIRGAEPINTWITNTTAQSFWVLSSDTSIVATNTARTYLEISNISGATSSASQTLYCSTGDVATDLYNNTPIVVQASTTRVWDLDGLYTGAIHCQFPSAAATIEVWEH